MNIKLFLEAIIKFLMGGILLFLLIFIPAGTTKFYNGWLLLALLFIPMFIAGVVMMIKNPDLLRSRLDVKEKEAEQKQVVVYSGIMFLIGFIFAGLDFRFNLTKVPNIIVIIFSIIFVFSYIIYGEVLRENAFLSRTIGVSEKQKVVDTGLYKIVRHPMYLVTLFLFLSMPIILGSWLSLMVFMAYPFIIVKRIKNEETVLVKELGGYKDYQKKVKYRLIPYIW